MALLLPKKRLLTRRGFLTGAAAAIAAPAIIRAQSLGGNSGISQAKVKSSGGGGYVAKAVHFDNNTLLSNGSNNLGADSYYGLFSVWVFSPDGMFYGPESDGDLLQPNNGPWTWGGAVTGTNQTVFNLIGQVGVSQFTERYPSFATGSWVNVLYSFNTFLSDPVAAVYYSDAVQTREAFNQIGNGPFKVLFNSGLPWIIGYDDSTVSTPNDAIFGDMADFQLYLLPSNFDLSVTANRRLFIGANGKPVNPSVAVAALGTPAICLSGDDVTFVNNTLGSAGAFSVVGDPITNASTSPSD